VVPSIGSIDLLFVLENKMNGNERGYGSRTLIERKLNSTDTAEWLLFRQEFLDAAGAKGDEDHSLAETLEGTDQQVGLSAPQTRRRARRRREALSELLMCIGDTDLKNTVRADAMC